MLTWAKRGTTSGRVGNGQLDGGVRSGWRGAAIPPNEVTTADRGHRDRRPGLFFREQSAWKCSMASLRLSP